VAIKLELELSEDVLFGAQAIGDHVGKPRCWVYDYQKQLGLDHVGATLIGRKSELNRRLGGGPASSGKEVA
jgi:hypothetical protein